MLTVYVKHYLTPDGFDYFAKEWFPKVLSVARQQEGFISISYNAHRDVTDRIDIVLKFQDDETLNVWIEMPVHDELISDLDAHRSRDYWEATKTTDETTDPSTLNWEIIKLY